MSWEACWRSGAVLVAAAGRGAPNECVWPAAGVRGPILSFEASWPSGAVLVAAAGRTAGGMGSRRFGCLLVFGYRLRRCGWMRRETLVRLDLGRVQGPKLSLEAFWPSGAVRDAAAGRGAKKRCVRTPGGASGTILSGRQMLVRFALPSEGAMFVRQVMRWCQLGCRSLLPNLAFIPW